MDVDQLSRSGQKQKRTQTVPTRIIQEVMVEHEVICSGQLSSLIELDVGCVWTEEAVPPFDLSNNMNEEDTDEEE